MQQVDSMGTAPVSKLLLKMAVPAVVSNVVNALYNIVDQIFIGQGVGFLGNAATSIAFPLTTLCLAIGLMTGVGAASNFSIELGRKNTDKAKAVVGTATTMLIVSGVVISTLVVMFLQPLMVFFGATDQNLPYAMSYAGITSVGIPFLLFTTGINPLVRADGKPGFSMIAVISGAVLNTILDPIFIFVFDMGIEGAAIATVISQIVSAVILFSYFPRFKQVKIGIRDFIPKLKLIQVITTFGLASFIFQGSTLIVQISLNNLLKQYGTGSIYGSDITLAVAGIVTKINVIFTSVIIGIVQGSQPIVGFNYGAQKYSRVKETLRLVLKTAISISIVAFIVFEFFPYQIIQVFGKGSQLYTEFAVKYIRIFLFFVCINGVQISSSTFFSAIGKPKKGAILSLIKQVVILLPLMFILPKFFGLDGIIYATPISDFIAFVVSVIFLAHEMKIMPNEVFEKV